MTRHLHWPGTSPGKKLQLLAAAILLLLLPLASIAQTATAPIAVTSSTLSIPSGYPSNSAAVVVDNAITLYSQTYNGFVVSISSGGVASDVLGYSAAALPSGVTGSYSSSTQTLTFTGISTAGNYQTLLRTVTITSAAASGTNKGVTFTVGNPASFNGHYYEVVLNGGLTWAQSMSDAATRTLYGLHGYMATITSLAENSLITSKLNTNAWISGYTPYTAFPRYFYWGAGPENNGTPFCNNYAAGGYTVITYANWTGGEPNNGGGSGETVTEIYTGTGTWNDLATNVTLTSYVVEYGGLASDNVTLSRTRNITYAPGCTTPAAFSVTGGGAYCTGGSAIAIGLSGSATGVNYQLKLNGTNTGSVVAGSGSALAFPAQTVAGTYTVTAADAATGACTATMTGSAAITTNPQPQGSLAANGPFCGTGTGQLTFTASAGTGPYTVVYNDGTANRTATGVASGTAFTPFTNPVTATTTYTLVSVQDVNCTRTTGFTGSATTITVNPKPTIYNVTGGGTYCTGGAGTPVGLDNSQSGVNYQLKLGGTNTGSPVAGTGSAISFGNQTAAGTYTVLATATAGSCTNTMSGSAVISINPLPQGSLTANGPFCGTGTGQLSFTATAGTAPFTVVYNDGVADRTATGVASGTPFNVFTSPVTATTTYTLVSVQGVNCTRAAGFTGGIATITVNPVPDATATPSAQTICSGDTITTIALTGSVSGTTYNWVMAANANVSGIAASGTGDINGSLINSGTTAETVTFTITPATSSCTGTATTATVTINPTPTVNVVSNQAICDGNTTAAIAFSSAVAGTTYSWANDAPSIGLAASGTGDIPSFTATNATAAPVTATISVTPTRTGCTGTTVSFTITVNPAPDVYNVTGGGTYCAGGTGVSVGLSNSQTGINYQLLLNGTATGSAVAGTGSALSFPDQTAAGTYTVTGVDAATNCSATMSGSVTVTVNPVPDAAATPSTQSICSGDTITTIALTGSVSGTTYNWVMTGNANVSGNASSGTGDINDILTNSANTAQTATFTISPTASGCTGATTTATVTVNPTPTVNAVSNQSLCAGNTTAAVAFSSAVAGTTYSWTNNTPSIGLAASGMGDIPSFTATNATATPVTAAISVTPTGGGTPACAGMPATFTITINPTPTVYNVTGGGAYCSGGTGVAVGLSNSQAGFNYQLKLNGTNTGSAAAGTGSALTFPNQTAGTYTITAADAATGTCTATMTGSATITTNPQPQGSLTANGPFCGSGSGQLTFTATAGTGPFTVVYNDGTANRTATSVTSGTAFAPFTSTVSATTTYTLVSVADANCTRTTSFTGAAATITVNPVPNAVATPSPQTICNGNAITTIALTGSVSGATYNWAMGTNANLSGIAASGTGNISGSLTNSSSTAQTATFTITPTAAGCTGATTIAAVTVNPTLDVTQPGNQTVCGNTSTAAVTFTGTVTGASYSWTNNTPSIGLAASGTGNIPAFTVTNTTTAPVTATISVTPTGSGTPACSGTPATFTITVSPPPAVYNVTGGGAYCSGGTGVAVGLGNSQTGYNYQLQLNGSNTGSVVGGTGAALTFPTQTAVGTYTVTAADAATGVCTATMSGSTTISTNPQPQGSLTANGPFCGTGSGQLTFTASAGTGPFTIVYNDGTANRTAASIANGTSFAPFTNPVTSTTAYTLVSVQDANCARSSGFTGGTATITVNPAPVVYNVTGGGAYCSGGTGVAVGLSNSQSGVNYQLLLNGSNTGSPVAGTGAAMPNAFPSQTSAGTYTVVATQTATGSCTAAMSGSVAITISPLPVFTTCPAAAITASTASNTCAATVTYTSTATNATSYSYTFTSATSGTGSGTGSGSSFNKGTTHVTVTATNTCTSVTCTFDVIVTDNQAPVFAATALGTVPSTITANVPEASQYRLAYSLDIPNSSNFRASAVPYSIDNSSALAGAAFNRVAYYMQLDTKWVWVSMDKFTSNVSQLGIPVTPIFQQNVANMNVVSSANAGVTNGTGITTGNIEFWSNQYNAQNGALVPGASVSLYDFGDSPFTATIGYGSFQVHNYGAAQTLFAYNNWAAGTTNVDLGIGTSPAPYGTGSTNNPDWTFTHNAAAYTSKKVYVFISGAAGFSPVTASTDAGQCSAAISIPTPAATDNCGTPTVTGVRSDNLALNATYPIGNTTITWTANDGTQTTTGTQLVTVTDNEAPVVACPGNISLPAALNTCAANYTITDPVSDNCTNATWGYTLSGATMATVTGIADGTNSSVISFNKGITTVALNGTDGTNTAAPCSFTVTVLDTQAPTVAGLPANISMNNTPGLCSAVVTWTAPTAADNCSGATIARTAGPASGSTFAVGGPYTITYLATDASGNTSGPQSFTVTVTDSEHPVLSMPANATVNSQGPTTVAALGSATATDNCGIQGVVTHSDASTQNASPNNAGYYNYTITRTWTATDIHGLSTSANQVITVQDITAPTVTAPAPVAQCDNGTGNSLSRTVTATDAASSPLTYSYAITGATMASGNGATATANFAAGTSTITWTVTDVSGNANSSAAATITIYGLPSISVTNAVNPSCFGLSNGSISTTATGGTPGYSYAWTPAGPNSPNRTGLAAGSYSVIVTDVHNCTATTTAILSQPAVLAGGAITATFAVPSCPAYNIYLGYGAASDTMTTAASGGTGPYTYSWSPAAGTSILTSKRVVAPTATTTYTATIADAHGCTATAAYQVKVLNVHCGPAYIGRELNNTVNVCHSYQASPSNLCVSPSAVPGHLAHGDCLAPCGTASRGVGDGDGGGNENDYSGPATITVYPNPAQSTINVGLKGMGNVWKAYQIVDLSGRLVAQRQLEEALVQDVITVDISALVPGVYLIKVTGEGGINPITRFTVQ